MKSLSVIGEREEPEEPRITRHASLPPKNADHESRNPRFCTGQEHAAQCEASCE